MKRVILPAALAACVLLAAVQASAAVLDRVVPLERAATVRVDVGGPVHVATVAGRNVGLHLVGYGSGTPPLRVNVSRSGSLLTISITGPPRSVVPIGRSGYTLDLSLPSSAKLDLREFDGDVRIDRVRQPMQVYDANGDVQVAAADAPLTVLSDLGNVVVRHARGMLELSCGRGSVTATLASGWHANLVRLEASRGDLTLAVPPGFRARYDLTSAAGRVTNPLRTTPHAPLVFMLTQRGNVTVDVTLRHS